MAKDKKPLSLIVLAVLLLCSCGQHRAHLVTNGFYYWKTIYTPTPFEQTTLNKLGVQRIYIRMFDVDLNPQTMQLMPVAPIQLPEHIDTATDFIPVVFITQQALAAMHEQDILPLAQKINGFTGALCSRSGIRPAELQIDCDWTAGTKDVYFNLLRELKRQPFFSGKTLSCTIRLHQVKYFSSSGIPPADKGLLMCYSMGDIKKYGVRNSILDVQTAKQYMAVLDKYPLPLDIGLPLFRWCALFRGQQFRGILHDVDPEMVNNDPLFKHKQANLYTCLRDTVWHGYHVTANDVVRTESVNVDELKDIARYTANRLTKQELNVVFFSCDSITLAKYSTHELETVYNIYR